MSYPTYTPSYADWKIKRTELAGVTYYIEHGKSYLAVVISKTAERVEIYQANIIRNITDPNLVDFETNIKSTATQKISIDDIIVAELGISGGQEPFVRIAFGSVPAAYGAGAQLVTTDFRNIVHVRNNTDEPVVISLDGATDHFYLASGEAQERLVICLPQPLWRRRDAAQRACARQRTRCV